MFTFCSLFSGSSGNCSIIQSENTKILIDIGESTKKIVTALEQLNIKPEEIDAILITHEHSDHTKGLNTFSNKYKTPIYINKETYTALINKNPNISLTNIYHFNYKKFNINDLEILPFSIPHDAANPCGFNIFKDGKKISIATDIGHITNDVLTYLEKSSFLLLEANYDSEVLKCSSYPYTLKQRIAGPLGHLSNTSAGKTISYLYNLGLSNVMLGHLSKENNFPELAYKTVVEELMNNQINENNIKLSVAYRDKPSNIIDIS